MRHYLKTSDSEIIFIDSVFKEIERNDKIVIGEMLPYSLTIIIGPTISNIRISADLIKAMSDALNIGKCIPIEDYSE